MPIIKWFIETKGSPARPVKPTPRDQFQTNQDFLLIYIKLSQTRLKETRLRQNNLLEEQNSMRQSYKINLPLKRLH